MNKTGHSIIVILMCVYFGTNARLARAQECPQQEDYNEANDRICGCIQLGNEISGTATTSVQKVSVRHKSPLPVWSASVVRTASQNPTHKIEIDRDCVQQFYATKSEFNGATFKCEMEDDYFGYFLGVNETINTEGPFGDVCRLPPQHCCTNFENDMNNFKQTMDLTSLAMRIESNCDDSNGDSTCCYSIAQQPVIQPPCPNLEFSVEIKPTTKTIKTTRKPPSNKEIAGWVNNFLRSKRAKDSCLADYMVNTTLRGNKIESKFRQMPNAKDKSNCFNRVFSRVSGQISSMLNNHNQIKPFLKSGNIQVGRSAGSGNDFRVSISPNLKGITTSRKTDIVQINTGSITSDCPSITSDDIARMTPDIVGQLETQHGIGEGKDWPKSLKKEKQSVTVVLESKGGPPPGPGTDDDAASALNTALVESGWIRIFDDANPNRYCFKKSSGMPDSQ